MPNTSQLIFFAIGCCATLALLFIFFGQCFIRPQNQQTRKKFKSNKDYESRKVITTFEKKMFLRLNDAFPEHYVLAQVAFSALITCEDYKLRAKFNRKVTDFVILDAKMDVIAIIELDDPSHIGKEQEDAIRDDMFVQAGYKVFRYTKIPSIQTLRKNIRH
mgnify:CR=1 FL=1